MAKTKTTDLILLAAGGLVLYQAYQGGSFDDLKAQLQMLLTGQAHYSTPPGVPPNPRPSLNYVQKMTDGTYAVIIDGREDSRYSTYECAEDVLKWKAFGAPFPSCLPRPH